MFWGIIDITIVSLIRAIVIENHRCKNSKRLQCSKSGYDTLKKNELYICAFKILILIYPIIFHQER